MPDVPRNLYMHFPFCRGKCAYCALFSRGGAAKEERGDYSRKMALSLARLSDLGAKRVFSTVYLGGGTPALCDLGAVLENLSPLLAPEAEVSVELHPLDVNAQTLSLLRSGGVNRISMGVQSLDDATLADMGRGYVLSEARRAFSRIREVFDNAGIDLIVGYPPPPGAKTRERENLSSWGIRHCSVYSLQLEESSALASRVKNGGQDALPSDDETLDELKRTGDILSALGLERYEISNWALKGYECRHNSAVWRGEDYLGLGDGAHGRIGLFRTRGAWGLETGICESVEKVSVEADRKERLLFRLRTREGIDSSLFPAWKDAFDRFESEGLMTGAHGVYRLTPRGMEVCDSLLVDLV